MHKPRRETRITITLKLDRRLLASMLNDIPEYINLRGYKDIVMYKNSTNVASYKAISMEEANNILIQRGFVPADLQDTAENITVNRDNKFIQDIVEGVVSKLKEA